jgi:hypothetical protein
MHRFVFLSSANAPPALGSPVLPPRSRRRRPRSLLQILPPKADLILFPLFLAVRASVSETGRADRFDDESS